MIIKMMTLRVPIINAVRNITCGDIFHNAPPNSGNGLGCYSGQFMNTNSTSGSMNLLMSHAEDVLSTWGKVRVTHLICYRSETFYTLFI